MIVPKYCLHLQKSTNIVAQTDIYFSKNIYSIVVPSLTTWISHIKKKFFCGLIVIKNVDLATVFIMKCSLYLFFCKLRFSIIALSYFNIS